MTATYSPFENKAPTVITKQVTIPKADGFEITQGEDTPTLNDPTGATYLTVVFKVKCGTKNAGSMIAALAQEQLTDRVVNGEPQDDTDWSPDLPSGRFYLSGGLITDGRVTPLTQAQWNAIDEMEVFFTGTQHLRLKYSDSCGNVKTMDPGEFDFKYRKVSATEWQMEVD